MSISSIESVNSIDSEIPEGFKECIVCLDEKYEDEFIKLPCNHEICKTCHPQLIRPFCPYCRYQYGEYTEEDENSEQTIQVMQNLEYMAYFQNPEPQEDQEAVAVFRYDPQHDQSTTQPANAFAETQREYQQQAHKRYKKQKKKIKKEMKNIKSQIKYAKEIGRKDRQYKKLKKRYKKLKAAIV